MPDPTRQGVLFPDAFRKPVWAGFDADGVTSNGGVLLLSRIDRRLRLSERAAQCLGDVRDVDRVRHAQLDLLRQRIYGLALGYGDGNDAERLRDDPAMRVACQRTLRPDDLLASQPTVSRFENAPSGRELFALAGLLEDLVVERLRRRHPRPAGLVIDFDPCVDPAHGEQQGALFNGFYDTHCYLPLFGFVSVRGDPEQHLFLARLRPGNAPAGRAMLPSLRRMVRKLKAAFPRASILVRLDSAFISPRLLRYLRQEKLRFTLGMQQNAVLERTARRALERVRRRCERSKTPEREVFEIRYRARTWSRSERVVVRAEAVHHPGRGVRATARYVVTNARRTPVGVYALYCGRGDVENRFKEIMGDLEADRTSCPRFVANQLRVLLSAFAFALLQEMRGDLRHSPLARAQVGRLRSLLLKIGARVGESVRRFTFHLAAASPFAATWRRLALRYGALSG